MTRLMSPWGEESREEAREVRWVEDFRKNILDLDFLMSQLTNLPFEMVILKNTRNLLNRNVVVMCL